MGVDKKYKNLGFTLIELIIVFGLIGLIFPVLFGIIFTVLRQQTKIIRLQTVINEGQYLSQTIKSTIETSAYKIYSDQNLSTEVCSNSDSVYQGILYFSDFNNQRFNYYLDIDNNRVASYSGIIGNSVYLNSPKTQLVNFSTSCQRLNKFSPPIININFTLKYNSQSNRPEDNVSLTFYNYIKLKSY